MRCHYKNCQKSKIIFKTVKEYEQHVFSHFNSEKHDKPIKTNTPCPWSNCPFKTSSGDKLKNLQNHVKYHIYHETIKQFGKVEYERSGGIEKLGECKVDQSLVLKESHMIKHSVSEEQMVCKKKGSTQ